MLTIRDLTFDYPGESLLRDVSITLLPGQALGLLGENGSGKTTLLRLIAGILKPTTGTIDWCGIKPNESGYRQQIGYLTQQVALIPQLSGLDNLRYWAALASIGGRAEKQALARVTHLTGISEFYHKKIQNCSGGMKRRVHLASVLLTQPQLLLLDEPMAGLDPENQEMLLTVLRHLKQEGTALVWVTHRADAASRLCEQILRLSNHTVLPFSSEC